jgi:TatD DNase family protein
MIRGFWVYDFRRDFFGGCHRQLDEAGPQPIPILGRTKRAMSTQTTTSTTNVTSSPMSCSLVASSHGDGWALRQEIPLLVDAHCHLQDGHLRADIPQVIARARAAGVRRLVCNSDHEGDWDLILRLAETYPEVIPSLGVHPWFVAQCSTGWLARLEALVAAYPVAVGEIGLDRQVEKRNDGLQEEVFLAQMELAARYDRPVSIHCRKAFGRLVELMASLSQRPRRMMLHAYCGSHEMVPVFEKLGLYLSVAGSVTWPKNRKTRTAAQRISKERLLVETDSPAIAPAGVPYERNEPAYLPMIVQELARLRGEDPAELARAVTATALDFFDITRSAA